MSGIVAVTNSQANLSALGARRCISPVNKMLSLFAELCAGILYQFLCTATSLLYMIFVLKIDFGSELFYVLLAAFVGCTTGVSAGFFIGSFGKMSVGMKNGIMMAIMEWILRNMIIIGNVDVFAILNDNFNIGEDGCWYLT